MSSTTDAGAGRSRLPPWAQRNDEMAPLPEDRAVSDSWIGERGSIPTQTPKAPG
jgi:hypothetical protein